MQRTHNRYQKKSQATESWLITYSDLLMVLLVFFVLLIAASDLKKGKIEKIMALLAMNERPEAVNLVKIKQEIQQFIVSEGMVQSVSLSLEDDGLEIRMDSGAMFDTAQSKIRDEVLSKLTRVLSTLPKYQHKYKLAIEGHTDDRPINGIIFKTNWELSSARAMEVRELMEKIGIVANRMRVEAYADTKPLAPKHLQGLSREDILSKHRRVVIRVY